MKHVLIIRLSAIGDVAMTQPIIKNLLDSHPEVRVTVVSRGFFRPLFSTMERVNFFEVDVKGKHKGFFGIFKLYNTLRKLNIDQVADLHDVLRSKILRKLFALHTKVACLDKGRREKKALTKHKNKVFKPLKPMSERYADVFRKLGYRLTLDKKINQNPLALTNEVLTLTKEKAPRWIGIAPFAQYDSKVYPIRQMEKIIFNLTENTDNHLFLFGGGKEEEKKLERMKQQLDNVTVVAGKLTFAQELVLISNLNLMISMDSGNGHLAAIYGVPTLTLWGNTHPFAGFAPYGQPFEHSLTSDRIKYPLIPTSVYGNKKVKGYENVMESISWETVIDKVEEMLLSQEKGNPHLQL